MIRLQPVEPPRSTKQQQLPDCAPLRVLCERVRDRPHVDIAVMVSLFMLANELQPVSKWTRGESPLFWVPPRVLTHMLAVGRNTPRRSIQRLAELTLLEISSRDGDLTKGIRVRAPGRWRSALALGHARRIAVSRGRTVPCNAPKPRTYPSEPRQPIQPIEHPFESGSAGSPDPHEDPWFDAPPPEDNYDPENFEPVP